ncbi:MAG: flagellar hook-associated protein FlgK [Armatimonadota bacterium]
MSLSVTLQTALQSLLAHQTALAVVSQNIANAQNPDYSRQVARLKASIPIPDPSLSDGMLWGQLGTGVTVSEISRQYDALLLTALRMSNSRVAHQRTLLNGLERLNALLSEPTESSLNSLLAEFFEAWRDLASNPENIGNRAIVIERARLVLNRFQSIRTQLDHEKILVRLQFETEVEQLNRWLEYVAKLNEQIVAAKTVGLQPNDLMDERDAVLRQIAERISIQVFEQPNGSVIVTASGHELVSNAQFRTIKVEFSADGVPNAVLSDTEDVLPLGEGILAALREFFQQILETVQSQLKAIVDNLAQAVNAFHQNGYGLDGSTGEAFFVLINNEWQVNPNLVNDPRKVAASATGSAGNGEIAASIAKLAEEPLDSLNGQSVLGAYRNLIGSVAARTQGVQNSYNAFSEVQRFLQNRRDMVSGVSIDEELVDLMRFQQAYLAAARVIQAVDNLVNELLSRL